MPGNRKQRRAANKLLSRGIDVQLRDMVMDDPSLIGQTKTVWLLASGDVDALLKGNIDRTVPEARRQLDDQQLAWVDKAYETGTLARKFNTGLFTNGASSQPETAGLLVALVGSFFMMVTVALLAVPIGVAAAIYLEEFAPKNRWTDLIEVNINNLAAVPSIVFGLLGPWRFHQLLRPAAVCCTGRRPRSHPDDPSDHHHRLARRHHRRAAVHP
jgi:phosphate transport system permease protein